MEQLKAELSSVLGESLTRLERVSEQHYADMYSLYDAQGHTVPLLAKTYFCQGVAQQEAYKLSMLAREGVIRMPTVYGIVYCESPTYREILLLERLRGVSLEIPTRTPKRWGLLMDQIIESVLAWHRIDSRGCVGTVEHNEENSWYNWYQQRIEALWSTLAHVDSPLLNVHDRGFLYRARASLPLLFEDFNESSVLVHGNLGLRSMLKDPRNDQLLAIVNPGMVLWAPREYELLRWCDSGRLGELLCSYLQRAPVAESFLARRWQYVLWESVSRFVHTGKLDRKRFEQARQQLLPWLV